MVRSRGRPWRTRPTCRPSRARPCGSRFAAAGRRTVCRGPADPLPRGRRRTRPGGSRGRRQYSSCVAGGPDSDHGSSLPLARTMRQARPVSDGDRAGNRARVPVPQSPRGVRGGERRQVGGRRGPCRGDSALDQKRRSGEQENQDRGESRDQHGAAPLLRSACRSMRRSAPWPRPPAGSRRECAPPARQAGPPGAPGCASLTAHARTVRRPLPRAGRRRGPRTVRGRLS
jgi:hypothetical protein